MKNKGFTLIELMIVVAIIAIIAAVAIPSLLRSRLQANESAAIGALQTIAAAQVTFHAANSQYTTTWTDLTTPAGGAPAFLIGTWGDAVVKQGYNFALAAADNLTFSATAQPAAYPNSGVRGFFIDQTTNIRGADNGGGPGTAADPVLGEA